MERRVFSTSIAMLRLGLLAVLLVSTQGDLWHFLRLSDRKDDERVDAVLGSHETSYETLRGMLYDSFQYTTVRLLDFTVPIEHVRF